MRVKSFRYKGGDVCIEMHQTDTGRYGGAVMFAPDAEPIRVRGGGQMLDTIQTEVMLASIENSYRSPESFMVRALREVVDGGNWDRARECWASGRAHAESLPVPGSRYIPADTRREVVRRDAGICGICGERIVGEPGHLDHKRRHRDGGTNTPDNLRHVHALCNLRRG